MAGFYVELSKYGIDVVRLRDSDGPGQAITSDLEADEGLEGLPSEAQL